jgi:4-amino-4-deoxy-L-arabinose transferase-like glycosyltransferase
MNARWLQHPAPWLLLALALSLRGAIDLRLTADSRDYFELAAHLASGEGFVTHVLDVNSLSAPDPRLHHPPGYSLLLAALQLTGLAPLVAARLLSSLAFTATAAAVWVISRALTTPTAAPVLMAGYLTIAALLEPWNYAMSETPFNLACAAFFAWTITHPRLRPSAAFAAGLLAGVAVLCRWIGAALPIATVLALWPRRRQPATWRSIAALATGSALLVLPWLARNYLATGRLMGKVSEPSRIPFYMNAIAFSRTLLLDLLPILLLALLAYAIRLPKLQPNQRPLLAWTAVYAALLLVLTSISFIDPIDARLTHPLYIALTPLLLALAWRSLRSPQLHPKAIPAAFALLSLTAVFQVANAARRAKLDPPSLTSPLSDWINQNTPENSLILNPNGAPVYFPAAGQRYSFVKFFHTTFPPQLPLERKTKPFPHTYLVLHQSERTDPWTQQGWQLTPAHQLQQWRIFQANYNQPRPQ